jgi:magnesium transporter
MPRLIKRASRKAGLPPGTLVHIGEKKTERVRITLIEYDEERCQEKEIATVEECFPLKDAPTVTWINVSGLHQVEVIEELGKHLGLHHLMLEDIVNTEQRPKLEDYGEHIFITARALYYEEEGERILADQISMILGPHAVVSFQEHEGNVLNVIRERILHGKGRVRRMGADYLAYALLDAIIDNYFAILERLGERIESLEGELIASPTPGTLHVLHTLKREMVLLRKSIWPLREVISGMERGESPLVKESTAVYLRDAYDHTIRVIETVETFRDLLSGMLDIYLSSISNRLNEVMKVLTIITTIFIPMTLIAGIYGMNFKMMPELEWQFGYPLALSIMGVLGVSLLIYFRRKRWL